MAEGIQQVCADVPCVGCGYIVRMQRADGVCPECHESVARTLRETAVRWGPWHLRKLGRSAVWMCVWALAVPLVFALMVAAIYAIDEMRLPERDLERALPFLFLTGLETCLILHVIAVVRFTTPPRGQVRSGRDRLISAGALLTLGTLAVPLLFSFLEMTRVRPPVGDSRKFIEFLLFAIPTCLAGMPVYTALLGEKLGEIYYRAGMAGRETLGKWSLRTFAAGVLMIDGLTAFAMLLEFSDARLSEWERLMEILIPLTGYGGLAIASFGFVGTLISLFLFARRMRTLAATLDGVTQLTTTIPPATDTPAPASDTPDPFTNSPPASPA